MRIFSSNFYKNLVWIYMLIVVCFSFALLMNAIPDHIYINENEKIESNFTVPVTFEKIEDGRPVFAEKLLSYPWEDRQNTGDYEVVCKLFGIIPIKDMQVTVIKPQTVFVSGRVIGIYGQTSGVLVLDTASIESSDRGTVSPSENRILPGDYILAMNDIEINEKEELTACIQACKDSSAVLTIQRKGNYIKVLVQPVQAKDGSYMLGIWVKDDMAGIGTMTYYTSDMMFGALGHGIGDGQTGELLSMSDGSIYDSKVLGVVKGKKGEPGELEGIIYYGKSSRIGRLIENENLGIYGVLEEEDYLDFSQTDQLVEIGYKQELEIGKALILSNVDGNVMPYEIEITEIDYQAKDSNKGIHFTVTDDTLLAKTGGIVQGMSGSPILQNGKLIGAVTHVLVNDPSKGYGIFIETMIEKNNIDN